MGYGCLGNDSLGATDPRALQALVLSAQARALKVLPGAAKSAAALEQRATEIMSGGAAATTTAPAASMSEGVLQTKVMGLPLWLVAVGGLGLLLVLKRRKAPATGG